MPLDVALSCVESFKNAADSGFADACQQKNLVGKALNDFQNAMLQQNNKASQRSVASLPGVLTKISVRSVQPILPRRHKEIDVHCVFQRHRHMRHMRRYAKHFS